MYVPPRKYTCALEYIPIRPCKVYASTYANRTSLYMHVHSHASIYVSSCVRIYKSACHMQMLRHITLQLYIGLKGLSYNLVPMECSPPRKSMHQVSQAYM